MALDTKYKAERYRIVVKSALKNVYYFEKKYGVGVERDTMSRHTEHWSHIAVKIFKKSHTVHIDNHIP